MEYEYFPSHVPYSTYERDTEDLQHEVDKVIKENQNYQQKIDELEEELKDSKKIIEDLKGEVKLWKQRSLEKC